MKCKRNLPAVLRTSKDYKGVKTLKCQVLSLENSVESEAETNFSQISRLLEHTCPEYLFV